tara:strand:- start:91 stop:1518 length:1428 start_codon:yes stop_codon:yes gene_type:complete
MLYEMQKKRTLFFPYLFFVIFKIITVFFYFFLDYSHNLELFEGLAKYNIGDAHTYIEPYINFTNGDDLDNVYRMPYYFIFYAIFSLFLNKSLSLSGVVILQLILDIFSSILLMNFAYKEYKSIKLTWVLCLLLAFSLHTSHYIISISPESLSYSFIIISFYCLYMFMKNKNNYYFIFSSFLFGYAVLLKPTYILFILPLIFTFYLLLKNYNFLFKIKHIIKKGILYIIPFLIMIAPWTFRNYKTYGVFILFYKYEACCFDLTLKAVDFIKIRGGDIIWHNYSAGNYFFNQDNKTFKIPEFFLCKSCDLDKVKKVRNNFVKFYNGIDNSDSLVKTTTEDIINCNIAYKEERPLNYYLYSRLRLIKSFLIHSGSYFMSYSFSEVGVFLKIFKIIQSLIYYIALFIGFPFLLFISFKKTHFIPIASIPVILILLYPVYFQLAEWRYFSLFFPFAILGFCIFLRSLYHLLKKLISDKTN